MSRSLFSVGAASAAVVAAAFAVAGCGSTLPDPVIQMITPSQIDQGEAPPVRLEADAVLPFVADYGSETTSVEQAVQVRIGGLPVAHPSYGAGGVITGFVPFGLLPATHDVSLTLADGRTTTLAGGFTVKPGQFPDAFELESIPDQKRGRPFTISIRAVGGAASNFKGVVELEASKGTITPTISDPFVAGVLDQQVTIEQPGMGIVITVRDAAGHTGQSNPFRVQP